MKPSYLRRPRKALLVAILAVATGLLPGCGSATSAESSESPSASTTTERPDLSDGPLFELLDEGDGPRQLLRYELTGTCPQRVTIEHSVDLQQKADGVWGPSAGPVTTIMELLVNATSTPDGIEITSEVASVRLGGSPPHDVRELLHDQMTPLIGMTTIHLVDDRGLPMTRVRVRGGPDLGPFRTTFYDVAQQALIPLPVEPVGVGAVWTSVDTKSVMGAPVTETTRTSVASIDGTMVGLNSVTSQTVAEGARVRSDQTWVAITKWDVQGGSTSLVDLSQPASNSSESFVSSSSDFEIPDSGELKQILGAETVITSVPADDCDR